jgi:hypothetical protein
MSLSSGQVTNIIFSRLNALATEIRPTLSKNFSISERICSLSLPDSDVLPASQNDRLVNPMPVGVGS